MDRRPLSNRLGVQVNFVPQNDGTFLIETTEDVQPHLDHNKALLSADDYHERRRADIWHQAHIPTTVIMQWLKEGVDVFNPAHDDAVNKKLNSNEWRYLKTSEVIL